jgi:hypothetical protein
MSAMRATCPVYRTLLFYHLIIFDEEYNLRDSSSYHFLHPPATYTVRILTLKNRQERNMDKLVHNKPTVITNDLQNSVSSLVTTDHKSLSQ